MSEKKENKEIDLRLEEMRQSHDIDMAKLRWEIEKFRLEQEAKKDKWNKIRSVLSPITAMAGPEIRKQLKKIGKEALESEILTMTCPKCGTEVYVLKDILDKPEVSIKCPKCQTITRAKVEDECLKPLIVSEPREPLETRLFKLEERVNKLENKILNLIKSLIDFTKKFE